jgi:carbonic anhydrase/acetyltransferase-like protein (isoleucine patch superfamily)
LSILILISQYPFKEQFGWDYPASKMDGKVTVGHDVWIGEDVTIIEGVTIGNGAIIGACSVVAKDVLPYTTVVGNPAKVVKIEQLLVCLVGLGDWIKLKNTWNNYENLLINYYF